MAVHKAKPLSGISLNYEVVGGTTAPTTFNKENTIWVNTGTAIGEHQFSNKDLSIQTISYNQKWSVESAYLSNTGAVVTGDAYWNITAFIDISNSRAVRYTGVTFIEDNRTNICFYDSSQNYISRQAMTAGSKTVTDIPSNAKYLRMCVRKNDKTDYQTLYIYVDKWVDGNIPTTGDVWIQTDIDKAPVSFNAIKKDELMIYPYMCKQWNGNTWSNVLTAIYKNGECVKNPSILVYDNGIFYSDYTKILGNISGTSYGSTGGTTVTKNSNYFKFAVTSSGQNCGVIYFNTKYDLTAFSSIRINGKLYRDPNAGVCRVYVSSGIPTDMNVSSVPQVQGDTSVPSNNKDYYIDISSIFGEYYIAIGIYANTYAGGSNPYSYADIYEIELV